MDEESDENENEDSESEDNEEFENTDESDDDSDESDSDMDEDEDLACAIEEDLKDRELKNELNTSNDVLSSLQSSSENAVESNGSLEVVPIYGDGNCLFRAIASGITTALISCERNEGGDLVDKVHVAMEAKLASELRSKAVDMLRPNRELCQSHAEDMGLDYLWEGDEYGSLDSRLKEMEKNSVYGGQPEILALTHVLERPIVVHFENQDKTTEFGGFFNSQPCHILYYPEEKDEQGQQKRAGHYDLRRGVRCQVYSIGDFVAVRGGKSKWYMAIISELDNDMEEVKLNFMERSGSLFSFSDEEEKWVSMSTIIHKCSVPCMDGRMRYSFDAVDIKNIREKMSIDSQ